jgi:GGDEF domain-containing protein
MNGSALPVFLLCGVSAYAGAYRLVLYFLSGGKKEDLHFALTCLSIAFYDALCVGLYSSASVAAGVLWQRCQFFAIILLALSFTNYALATLGRGASRFKHALFATLAATALVGLVFPEAVASVSRPNPRDFLFLGMQVRYFEARVSPLFGLLYCLLAVTMGFLVAMALPGIRSHRQKHLAWLSIGIPLILVSLGLDILIGSNLILAPYTTEYSLFLLVLAMDLSLQRRYVSLLAEVESLNTGLEAKVEERTTEIRHLAEELSGKNFELLGKNAVLAELAERDGLTKLLNHVAFQRRLVELLGASRRQGFTVALIMIDLDWFKEINDTWGHQAGDWVLMLTADILRSGLRDCRGWEEGGGGREAAGVRIYDVPGRYGGDEFAVILPWCDGPGVERVCERIRELIEKLRMPAYPELRVTASLGAAIFTPDAPAGTESDDVVLMREADAALYVAKSEGKGRAVLKPRPF